MLVLRPHLRLAVALLMSLAGLPAAETPAPIDSGDQVVEVFFVNGDSTRGVVVSKTAETLVLHVTIESKGTRIVSNRSFPMAQVKLIVTLADEYRLRATNTPNSPPEQAELARWCLDRGLHAEARGHALKALDVEPVNRNAQSTMRALNLVQLEDTWLDVDAWLAAKKLVRFDGLAVTEATRENLKQLNLKRAMDANALTEAKQTVEQLTNLSVTAKERTEKIEKSRAEATTAAANADGKQKAVDGAKAAVTAAAKRVEEAGKANIDRNQTQDQQKRAAAAAATARDHAEAAKKKANEALSAAQKELSAADPASAKARKARLDTEAAKAKTDAEKSAKELPAAQAAIPAKQAAADASAKAYADARAAVQLPADLPKPVVDFLAADVISPKK